VARRKPVAAGSRIEAHVIYFEDAADGLVLQPFAHVALVRAGRRSELGGGSATTIGERAIETEAISHVDHVEVIEPQHRLEQALDERVSPALDFSLSIC
jgi:hypothetical protein